MADSSKRFEGDPRLTLNEGGADLTFKGGQPVMDRGLENAALISLYTEPGWFGNLFTRNPSQRIGSDFMATQRQAITLDSINDIRSAAESALQWMLNDGIASDITVRVSNPVSRKVQTVVLIKPVEGDIELLLLTKYGDNWISQKLDPAHLRL